MGDSTGLGEPSLDRSRGPGRVAPRSVRVHDTDDHYLTLWLLMYNGCLAHARTFSPKGEIRGRRAARPEAARTCGRRGAGVNRGRGRTWPKTGAHHACDPRPGDPRPPRRHRVPV